MSERRPRKKAGKESLISRRTAITGGFAASAVGTTTLLGSLPKSASGSLPRPLESHEHHGKLVNVDFKEMGLAGETCTGLACHYFDMKSGERYPEGVKEIDFVANLQHLWAMKVAITRKNRPERAEAMHALADKRVKEYEELFLANKEQEGPRNFNEFVTDMADTARTVLKGMDWDGIAKHYNIQDDWTVSMLKHLASRAHGRSLAAFSMTEVMPAGSGAGANAIRTYDTVLRYAGAPFIDRVPAIGDPLPSYGRFQPTSIAVDHGLAEKRHGVSLIDLMSPETRIPEHIVDYKTGAEQTSVAVLLGLDALAVATARLRHNDVDDERITRIARMDGGTFASVLAAHHYRPTVGRPALLEWSEDANWANDGTPHQQYHEFCAQRDVLVGNYSRNSYRNFEEVEGYFKLQGY